MLIAIATIVLALLLVATVCDLRSREIPDWISLVMVAFGLTASLSGFSGLSFTYCLSGIALGVGVTAPLFYLGGIGGGDVKLIAALGSILGPLGLLSALFWVAIAGGGLALIAKLRGQSDFAYVPAIFFGVLITCCVRGIG